MSKNPDGGSENLPPLSDEASQKIKEIIESITDDGKKIPEDSEAAEELAKLLILLESVKINNPEYLPYIQIAIEGLILEKPNVKFSREIRGEIRKKFNPKGYWVAKFLLTPEEPSRWSPTAFPVYGLVLLSLICLVLFPELISKFFESGMDLNEANIGMQGAAALMGAIGSAVSILIRLKKFDQEKDVAPIILFCTGFFKPIVGASFAVFVYFGIEGGIAPFLKVPETDNKLFFHLAIAFVSGFSERFAKDFSGRIEKQVISEDDQPQPTKVK